VLMLLPDLLERGEYVVKSVCFIEVFCFNLCDESKTLVSYCKFSVKCTLFAYFDREIDILKMYKTYSSDIPDNSKVFRIVKFS
jgi:hypothetical protein